MSIINSDGSYSQREDSIHRSLTKEEVVEFRRWARENHNPGQPINKTWHPVVQEECNKMNWEAKGFVVIDTTFRDSHVICDLCNKDWTNSDVSGGFIFGSNSVCPDCAPSMLESAKKHGEEKYIRSKCPEDMSHADWIRSIR